MKKIVFLCFVLLFLSCANSVYKVDMTKPDGSIDTYYFKTELAYGIRVVMDKNGSVSIYTTEETWAFEDGKYVGWHISKVID